LQEDDGDQRERDQEVDHENDGGHEAPFRKTGASL
jgi:hypothetical protein